MIPITPFPWKTIFPGMPKKSPPTRKAPTKTPARPKTAAATAADVDPAFAPVVRQFEKDKAVDLAKSFASYGLRVQGRIFAMHAQGNLVVKLPADQAEAMVSGGTGDYFKLGKRVMREWVALGPKLSKRWIAAAKAARAAAG